MSQKNITQQLLEDEMKMFCPNIHSLCTDGQPEETIHVEPDLHCIFWDSLNSECIFVAAMITHNDAQRMAADELGSRMELNTALKKQLGR